MDISQTLRQKCVVPVRGTSEMPVSRNRVNKGKCVGRERRTQRTDFVGTGGYCEGFGFTLHEMWSHCLVWHNLAELPSAGLMVDL